MKSAEIESSKTTDSGNSSSAQTYEIFEFTFKVT